MSRENTPTDDAMAERFMKTFKEHKINGITIEDLLTRYTLKNPNFRNSRSILNQYVKSLNEKPNKKSLQLSPERHDKQSSMASMLMAEPIYSKAFSERFGKDIRNQEIGKFKDKNLEVISILQELAAKKSEIVDTTTFDDYESNLALKLIDQRLTELYSLTIKSPLIVSTIVLVMKYRKFELALELVTNVISSHDSPSNFISILEEFSKKIIYLPSKIFGRIHRRKTFLSFDNANQIYFPSDSRMKD
jgi:hypothetical protein